MKLFSRKAAPKRIIKKPESSREYYYLGEALAITRLNCGHYIYVDPLEESVCSHLIAHGDWEPWAREIVMNLVGPGDHVLEVGGHVGYYTIGLAHKVGPTGSVTTFEANPRMAALSQRSVRFNGYSDWTKVIQKAVTDKAGEVRFTISRQFAGGGHLFIRDGMLGKDAEAIVVPSVRIDDLELPDIKLIRIDAEGSEAIILGGSEKMLAKNDIIICMEWDRVQISSRSNADAFITGLSEKGFKFWEIIKDGSVKALDLETVKALPPCDLILAKSDIFAESRTESAAGT